MGDAIATCSREPSDRAWRNFGDVAARILENLAERDARAAAKAESTPGAAATGVEGNDQTTCEGDPSVADATTHLRQCAAEVSR